jgi:hypothetical protein
MLRAVNPLRRFALALAVTGLAILGLARPAHAKPVSPELMAKLAAYAASFDALEKRASYRLDMKFEVLGSDGNAEATMDIGAKVDAPPGGVGEPKFTYTRFIEDGKDKTAEKQAETKSKKKNAGDVDVDLELPVEAAAQASYTFDETERTEDGTRVKIQFTPLHPGKRTVEGSAWVDVETGAIVSASFRMSRTPMFVHYVHFIVEFGAVTALVPSISRMTVDGEFGFLFFKRRFRANATLSDYVLAP